MCDLVLRMVSMYRQMCTVFTHLLMFPNMPTYIQGNIFICTYFMYTYVHAYIHMCTCVICVLNCSLSLFVYVRTLYSICAVVLYVLCHMYVCVVLYLCV